MNINERKLYLVTDYTMKFDKLLNKVEEALKGGVSIIQYRSKNKITREMCMEALILKELSHRYNALFIVNDRVDVALVVDADGVHVGQDDMEVREVRNLISENKIIGASVHNMEETKIALDQGADYLGVGAIYSTDTKKDVDVVPMEMLKEIRKISNKPIYGIGGIKCDNLTEELLKNIDGIAVVSEILLAEDIKEKSRELLKFMQ